MNSRKRARKYLMGYLTEEESIYTEDLYFRDNNFFAEIIDTQEELTEKYVKAKLGGKDKIVFERRFLNTNDKVKGIEFDKYLITEIKNHNSGSSFHNQKPSFKSKIRNLWKRLASKSFKIVAILIGFLIIVAAAYLIISNVTSNKSETITIGKPKIDEWRINFFEPEISKKGEKQEIINKFLIDVKTAPGSDIYMYLFYLDKNKNITTLFPNSQLSKLLNPFKAERTYQFPSSDGSYGTTNMHNSDNIILIGTLNPWKEMENKIFSLESGDETEKSTLNSEVKQLIVNSQKSDNFYIKIYTINNEYMGKKDD